jgi:predicted lipoprotein with Yx(FWY)xxD motif
MLIGALAVMPALAAAGQLKVPLRGSEMVLWSRPAQVDFWVPDEVVILQNPIAQFLADTNGMILYAFHCEEDHLAPEEDPAARYEGSGFTRQQTCARVLKRMNHAVQDGQPRCVGSCMREHPPLIAARTAVARGDWSLVERDDGTHQWAYKGHPLYRYARDAIQGYPAGTQTGGVWEHMRVDGQFAAAYRRLARNQVPTSPALRGAAPGVKVQSTPRGSVLADYRGMTLYISTAPSAQNAVQAQVTPSYLPRWEPLPAPALASAIGEWTVSNEDGIRQWAYNGKLVYTCDADLKPGDVNCSDQGWVTVAATPQTASTRGRLQ